ncbi:MAG: protein kinase [Gemmatimonadota bacterium]|jgi:dienelactone hydrolase
MIGTTFGHYRILEKIGQGGMGEVYLADDSSLQRKVALKFLPTALAESEEFRERFLVEARAAAALTHPNICVIHEVGEVGADETEAGEARGRPFMAMEYVEGQTLRERIRAGTLAAEAVPSILHQVVAGLEEAHAKGIVHRDIKSSNIMLTARGQAKIMDFGLAKVRGGPALTKTLTTLGTVAYMSPEQAAGDEVDHRSDLWSTGVVLYEMLTGELPFQGERETAVVHHILHEPPKPFQELKPPIPAALRRIAHRALEKDPKDRYASAGEMLEDLARYEAGVQAEELGVFNVRSLVKRLRRPVVAIPTAAAVVAVILLGAWFAQRRAEIRWAREEVLPEVRRLIEANDVWRNLVEPYRLAEQAEAVLGENDPDLSGLFSQVSLNVDVQTDPPGADVYMKEYVHPEEEWTHLGVTPLEGVRVPVGIFRWKLEKQGYEAVLAAASTWGGLADYSGEGPTSLRPSPLVRTLDPEGTRPPGMVRVPATEIPSGLLPDFLIGQYEVTNREYRAFVDAGGYRNQEFWRYPFVREGRELTWEEAMQGLVDPSGQPGPATWMAGDYPSGQDDYPVSGVSWYEAAAYAEYSGMSLPTASHWDVARGALTPLIASSQMAGFNVLAPFANFAGEGPMPVGSMNGLTAYGAYDMAGNVREWCWNEMPGGRAILGGSWDDNAYEFGNLRQAPPLDRSPRNGIRLAFYPDREGVPAAVLGPLSYAEVADRCSTPPVSEEVFQVYREQFAYDPTPLNAEVENRGERAGGWTLERVSFDAAYGGERVMAYLFLPTNTPPPYQTVVYFPGSAATMIQSSSDMERYYEFTMFLSFLVKNGRAVLFPIYKGTFERGGPDYPTLHAGAETIAYTEFAVQLVKDFRRAVDYLETRPDIDSQRLAFYGMSWGGVLGGIIPAVEDRLRANILLAGSCEYRPVRPEVAPATYLPRISVPTLMMNGRYDRHLDVGIRPMYDLLGAPEEEKRLILYETDHIPPRAEYVREIIAWLDEYLGPVYR